VIGVEAGVAQRVVFRRIAVRPAVDRDAFDVVLGIEATRAKDTAELVADIALEGLERCRSNPRVRPCAVGSGRLRGRASSDQDRSFGERTPCADIHRGISWIDEKYDPGRTPMRS
jgi:hypothetical protein